MLRIFEAALESLDLDAGVMLAIATVIEKGVDVDGNCEVIENLFNQCLRILRHIIEHKQEIEIISACIRILCTLLHLSSKHLYTLI